MKNIKVKKLSKELLFSLFIIQFVFGTSFAPVVARAQEAVDTTEGAEVSVEPTTEEVENTDENTQTETEISTEVDQTETEILGEVDQTVTEETSSESETESFGLVSGGNNGGGHDPVNICHAAGQSGNYVFLTVDDDGAYGGHDGHENDIIPITDVNGDEQVNQADCDYTPTEEEVCDASINLFENGGFENPALSGSWNIYADGTSGLAWDVQWQAGSGDETPAKAELQQIYSAHSGEQYLELDSDFDGPGGSISNEAASTRISQTITTVPGQEYEISYFYSARPGYGYNDNKVGLYIDGFPWDLSVTTNGVGDSDTSWAQKFNHFTADSTSHTITFADLGTSNSFGMFLDDVRVNCVEDDGGGKKNTPPDITVVPEVVEVFIGTVCDEAFILNGVTADDLEDGNITSEIEYAGAVDCNTLGTYIVTYDVEDSEGLPADQETRTIRVVNNDDEDENPSCESQAIWARVVVTSYSNVGAGDVTNHIYLGSNINMLMTGEWFPVNPADIQNIENFADVEGLAVKRRNDGKIVLELHGSHLPKGTGQEYAEGYIEFFNGIPTVLTSATGQNKLETGAAGGHEDLVWITGDKAYFDLGVGTADDRFSTTYTYSLDEECDDDNEGGDDNNPPAIVLADECILWSAESFNFTSGVTTSDADGDTVTLTYVVSPDPIVFGANGVYTITYTADDGQDSTVVSKTLTIDEDCEDDNGGDGDGDGDGDDNNGGGGGGGSSGSILGGGGSNRQGEVLGATTTACAQFTQYHDTGSTKSEVKALQTFLNEYMNAGLVVNGVYDRETTQAIHNFQALHWDAIIKPWLGAPSKISPNTTGRTRQMTTQALNFIMECPNDAMYLEDPQIFYKLTEIKNKKEFTADQIMKVANILDEVHGVVLGTEVEGK